MNNQYYYSISIKNKIDNTKVFNGIFVIQSNTIQQVYNEYNYTNNILVSGNVYNLPSDNSFINGHLSYAGIIVSTIPYLDAIYHGTAWNIYYDLSLNVVSPITRMAYRNFNQEWVMLDGNYLITLTGTTTLPSPPIITAPIPYCSKTKCVNVNELNETNQNSSNRVKGSLTQKDNKKFNTSFNNTGISKKMRFSQVLQMPKNSVCSGKTQITTIVVTDSETRYASLKTLYQINLNNTDILLNFSYPGQAFGSDQGGSQITGSYIATNLNGQYVTIVANNLIYVSNNGGVSFSKANIITFVTTNTYSNMHSVSISDNGRYQFATSNGSNGNNGVYYSNDYGNNWTFKPYYTNNNIAPSNLRWSQCTCISPSGQYMFAGGGGSGDGFDGTNNYINNVLCTGGWYNFYSSDYGNSWTNSNTISDRISCGMNPNTLDVFSTVNFNSAYNVYSGLILQTNLISYPNTEIQILPFNDFSRPFKIAFDYHSNVFVTAINTVYNLNNLNNDFIHPSTPMYGYHSDNGGSSFSSAIVLPAPFIFISYNSSGSRLWGCNESTLFYSKDHGYTWFTLYTQLTDIYGFALSKDGNYIYIFTRYYNLPNTNYIFKANVSGF